MYASTQRRYASYSGLFRWTARLGGAILFVVWFALVIAESVRSDLGTLSTASFSHAAALAIVFFGYAVGWRDEMLGGLLAMFGTTAYFLIVELTTHAGPSFEAAGFAAPGLLYLLAWLGDRRNVKPE